MFFDKEKKEIKNTALSSTYGMRYSSQVIPKEEMPADSMPAKAAYQYIKDEMNLDGNPAQNLASFVTTWMEPEADKLIAESINKNFIDHDEYPQTEVIHQRMVKMLAKLFNAPDQKEYTGTATIGSSEAIMLGLLAHKWSWKNRRKKEGKSDAKPNIVFGADVHVCWEKFAKYFDVEQRMIPMEEGEYVLTVDKVAKLVDENTICVGAILGTTFTGQHDPIEEINDYLLNIKEEKGWDIPIHVDGASGGFVAPFVYPDLKWDFRLEQVRSINVSGHKYGLVYPGLGWLIFREKKDFPEDLVFMVNYLGGQMPTMTLNFSRGGSMIIAQYYNFIRLGRAGYERIMKNVVDNAKYLSDKLVASDKFETLNPSQMLPVVPVKLKDDSKYNVFDLAEKLRSRGWIIPAYTLPPNAEKISMMRIVVKENFSRDMADLVYDDIMTTSYELEKGITPKAKASGVAKIPKLIC